MNELSGKIENRNKQRKIIDSLSSTPFQVIGFSKTMHFDFLGISLHTSFICGLKMLKC